MPVFGLNNGMVPIIAYNYGARKPERIVKTIKLSVMYAVGIMLLGLLAFQLIPDVFLGMFMAEDSGSDMLTIGVPALRIISISFLLAGFSVVCSSVFQALGHGVLSLAVSVIRQLVVLLPVAFVLSRVPGAGRGVVGLSHRGAVCCYPQRPVPPSGVPPRGGAAEEADGALNTKNSALSRSERCFYARYSITERQSPCTSSQNGRCCPAG